MSKTSNNKYTDKPQSFNGHTHKHVGKYCTFHQLHQKTTHHETHAHVSCVGQLLWLVTRKVRKSFRSKSSKKEKQLHDTERSWPQFFSDSICAFMRPVIGMSSMSLVISTVYDSHLRYSQLELTWVRGNISLRKRKWDTLSLAYITMIFYKMKPCVQHLLTCHNKALWQKIPIKFLVFLGLQVTLKHNTLSPPSNTSLVSSYIFWFIISNSVLMETWCVKWFI